MHNRKPIKDNNSAVVVPYKNQNINQEFRKWLNEALKEDAEILDELAER